jgi:hypothetical protein
MSTSPRLDVIAHSAFQVTTASLLGALLDTVFPAGRMMTDTEALVEMIAQSSISSYLSYLIATGESFVPDPLGGFVFVFFLFGNQPGLLEKSKRIGGRVLSTLLSLRLTAI